MNLLQKSAARLFGYDATEDTGRRAPPKKTTSSEDLQANDRKRKILSATTRDLSRNFAIAAWAIRKHLDYVSRFTFQGMTPDREYNKYLEETVAEQMTRHRFESSMRHPYRRAVRLLEASRVKDGDVFWLKLAPPEGANRGKVQAIEGDRIRNPRFDEMPKNSDPKEWVNGIRVNGYGAAKAFAVCDRDGKSLKLRRIVTARNMLSHGFYDRYDQVRGISPIAAGLNWFRDTYEGFEYSLAKVKIESLFGLTFYRDGMGGPFGGQANPTVDSDGDGEADSGYSVDLTRGPFTLDLNPGDRAEFLTGKNPSNETVSFLNMMIGVAIKSLDIPFSFFDESFTNFYGSRGGLIQYLKSTRNKIEDLQEFQNEWARWRIGLLVNDGLLELPAGEDFSFLKWLWVPDGVPWWDPIKEVRGNSMSVAAGFTSPQRVCREIGTDFEENVLQTAEAIKFAEDNGVELRYADSTAFQPEQTTEQIESDNA